MIPTSTGIFFNLKDEEYRQIPAVSQSTLKRFVDCPQKFKLAPKKEPTPAMIWGSLVDSMWLSHDTSRFVREPQTYETKGMKCPMCGSITDSKKCAKCKCQREEVTVEKPWSNQSETCREWAVEQMELGNEVISHDMWVRATNACRRLDSVPEIAKQRERCDVQVAIVSDMDGILVKGLLDMVPKDGFRTALGDLKTAPSADPRAWSKYVFNNRLHWQAAMYLDLWNKESGENLEWFYHFCAEQEPPHEPCMMPLSPEFINLGRRDYQRALRLYGECLEKDEWPGYPMNVEIAPEPWMGKES